MSSNLRTSEQLYRIVCIVGGFLLALMVVSYTPSRDVQLVENQLLQRLDEMQKMIPKQPSAAPQQQQPQSTTVKKLPPPVKGQRMNSQEIEQRQDIIRANAYAITQELRQTRLLCMVLARPDGDKHMKAVIKTWGKRFEFGAGILTFMQISDVQNSYFYSAGHS